MRSGEILKQAHAELISDTNIVTQDEFWQKLADRIRDPLVVELFKARESAARLLVTYRCELLGTWYEDTARDCGLELDGLGFIKGPYKHDGIDSLRGQKELKLISQEKYLTIEDKK